MEFRRFNWEGKVIYNRKLQKICTLDYENERFWEPSYLKAKCKELNLEEEYNEYQVRLMISYLGVFFLLHICVTASDVAVLLLLTEYPSRVFSDVVITIFTSLLMLFVLSVNFSEDFVQRRRWVLVLSSVLATLLLVAGDLGVNLYHYVVHDWPLNSSKDIYALCLIYMFLPIPSLGIAFGLALFVSVIYVAYLLQVLGYLSSSGIQNTLGYDSISKDIFHYFGFNLLGIFFRIMNDTMVRASFLDRHQFIMEEIWLRHALLQESMLLDNTLPPQIAKPYQEHIRNRIMQSDSGLEHGSLKYQSSMTVQMHPNVTILYADVVNYTYLTTTLSVGALVKVLHDLYGRFDTAASLYKVQRIKFLGDCYYCVAGLGGPDVDHAQNAVALGLSMIANIQEVREERGLDIDMRIGVHSGSLYAGIIGQAKLQFDIWGVDVDIANHLESTGKPGFVHISGRTLIELNESEYTISPGTEAAQKDELLQKHTVRTYLVTEGAHRSIASRSTTVTERQSIDIRSRPVQGTQETSQSMTAELHEEFRKMPVGGFDFRRIFPCFHDNASDKKPREIKWCCTAFENSTLEKNYIQQPDFTFKGSMLLAWFIGVCLIYIQIVDNFCFECIAVDAIAFAVLTSLLFISWYKKFCWWRFGQDEFKGYGKFSCRMFHVCEKVQRSLFLRISCYLVTIACYSSVIFQIVVDCDRQKFELEYIESNLFHYEVNRDTCFHTWALTNMIALIMGMSYTFARIPFAFKTWVSFLETLAYLLLLFFPYQFVFQHSNTTAPFLRPEVAHCIRILLMLITLNVKERQVEFIVKTNYRLNVNLKNKQKMANATNQSILILLKNILPSHVVELYLDSLSKHELYYENYKMISVMFAKLMNFQMDLPRLRVLNCIISEFDTLLSRYKEYYLVEKIKVVGCTYMAACGLDFNLAKMGRPSMVIRGSSFTSSRQIQFDRVRTGRRQSDSSVEDLATYEVVYLMTTFALDLMRTLASCNKAYSDTPFDRNLSSTEIAIGISSGEVMAGVVGASQPHYDIWGNPVNMASRMQSTGLPGHIQVTEESAEILMDFGVHCVERGLTFVKGRGEIPTYFVAFDKKLRFISTEPREKSYSLRRLSLMSVLEADDAESYSSEDESS